MTASTDTAAPLHVVLVTGRFAAPALRQVAEELERAGALRVKVVELPIQVAALMTADWLGRKLTWAELPADLPIDRVVLPGYCRGEPEQLAQLSSQLGAPVELGPAHLHDLPRHFGQHSAKQAFGPHDLEIIAEVNHAAQLSPQDLLAAAQALAAAGADVIDIGCEPHVEREPWVGVAEAVRLLREAGLRVSVDSFHPREIELACAAGAELVLSVNSRNVDCASTWGAEVVVVPDEPGDWASLERTLGVLGARGVKYRIDPILEPIGFGFAASLGRYLEARRRWPDAALMMGVGNLSEMTEVDSAGVNALLAGFCQEVGIRSVLTTQVINWARSSVAELDHARRLMHYAVTWRTTPKHLDEQLAMLRDPRLRKLDPAQLEALAQQLTDDNVRLFADPQRQQLHALKQGVHAVGDDPFTLFDQLGVTDASHAFYLGFELCKALTALTLHKNYEQDTPLNWGLLTRAEVSHFERHKRLRRSSRAGNQPSSPEQKAP